MEIRFGIIKGTLHVWNSLLLRVACYRARYVRYCCTRIEASGGS
jgi:hypothetical protein